MIHTLNSNSKLVSALFINLHATRKHTEMSSPSLRSRNAWSVKFLSLEEKDPESSHHSNTNHQVDGREEDINTQAEEISSRNSRSSEDADIPITGQSMQDRASSATHMDTRDAMARGTTPSRLQQMFLTKDWWTMWIGLLSFALAVVMTFLVPFERGGSSRVRYVVPQPMKWTHNPSEAWDLYNVGGSILLLTIFLHFYLLSLSAMGKLNSTPTTTNPGKTFAKGFVGLCIVATIAFWIGSQRWCQQNGFGYAIWSIIFGMIIGNSHFAKGEDRLKSLKLAAKDGEYFIKCSLVLLAVEFSILGELGLPALAVAWGASPITLVSSYMIGRNFFKMDAIPAILIATGATWCGASAISAIATVVSASNHDTVACIGIVATGTIVFTFLQPYFALLVGMDHYVAGAWIGGSVDQTGNVIASAAIISDEATEVAGIVKIILNSGLGVLATFVAIWWQMRPNTENADGNKGISWLFLWDKFPKFVLGYLICSGVLSAITKKGTPEGDALQFAVHSMSKWWFSIAFVALGVSTNLTELYNNTKSTGVIKLYLVSNMIDMALSFLVAWLVFSK